MAWRLFFEKVLISNWYLFQFDNTVQREGLTDIPRFSGAHWFKLILLFHVILILCLRLFLVNVYFLFIPVPVPGHQAMTSTRYFTLLRIFSLLVPYSEILLLGRVGSNGNECSNVSKLYIDNKPVPFSYIIIYFLNDNFGFGRLVLVYQHRKAMLIE